MDYDGLKLSMEHLCIRIQELSVSPGAFVLHRTKCCSLAKSYGLGFNFACSRIDQALSTCLSESDHALARRNLTPSLSELHHAMLQGEKFMSDCLYHHHWVGKAVVLALSTEAVDAHLHDLVWCLCVINQAVEQVLVPLDHQERRPLHVFEHDLHSAWAKTCEEEDLDILLEALDNLIAGDDLRKGDPNLHLARFLRQKLSVENLQCAAADQVLPSCMWVDPVEFVIIEAVGHGANAVVYEVKWCGNLYGQKEFFGADEQSFSREAVIHSKLRHPNVVQLICCTAKPARKKCSLVMELMQQDLRTMIINRMKLGFDPPFSLLTALDIMLQIAKGMEYLHALGIMHRDLKSLNVLVSMQVPSDLSGSCRLRVKVADFGMAKVKYFSSQFTTLHAGTTYWRAPEVFEVRPEDEYASQHNSKYNKKADVYSFGMVCYEILTGKIPFDDGGKLMELHTRLLRGERPCLPSSCPQYLASYIERCWHGSPDKRPTFAQISRTLRHLKGILLTSADPFSSALSNNSCAFIEDKLEQMIGANWVSAVQECTLRSFTISFEMSWYKVIETNMIKQEENETNNADEREEATENNLPNYPPVIKKNRRSKMEDFLVKWMHSCIGIFSCQARDNNLTPSHSNVCWELMSVGGDMQRLPTMESAGHSSNLAKVFTYKELYDATQAFSNLIGRGGSGSVFSGTLVDAHLVAVKVMARTTRQSQEEFAGELTVLSGLRHRNLVPLLGWCCEKDNLFLVYEYMPGGDLRNHMFGDDRPTLSWAQRYNIGHGLASALNYLHHECMQQVLHRDVKPSNVLLDADYNARLADFGIARLLEHEDSHVTTNVRGTIGYIAPEYVMTLKLGPEADVYSFGVVLLELACGRRVVDFHRNDRITVMQHVWKHYKAKRLLYAGDERLDLVDDLQKKQMKHLLLLGLACTQNDPKDRPTMKHVYEVLTENVDPPKPLHPPYGMS